MSRIFSSEKSHSEQKSSFERQLHILSPLELLILFLIFESLYCFRIKIPFKDLIVILYQIVIFVSLVQTHDYIFSLSQTIHFWFKLIFEFVSKFNMFCLVCKLEWFSNCVNCSIQPLNASPDSFVKQGIIKYIPSHFSRLGILQHHYVHDHLSVFLSFTDLQGK